MEAQVLRPMISTWPIVSRLKRRQSSGIRQGMSPSAPMTPLRATAAIPMISTSDGDRGLDAGVRVVALDPDAVRGEVVDRRHRRVEHQPRQGSRLAGQLQPGLVEVVQVEVGIAG